MSSSSGFPKDSGVCGVAGDTPCAPMRLDRVDGAILFFFACLKIGVHMLCLQGYGIFRDELYYWDCSNHLAWGYVDHPPLSMAILAGTRAFLGDALWALRLPVVFIGAGTIVLSGLIARRLGGGRFSMAVSCLSFTIAGVYLGQSSYYSMNALDLFLWAWAVYALAGIVRTGDPRGWLWFGLAAGLGLQNKLSMGFLGLAMTLALLCTKERQYFRGWHLWAGGGLAFLIFLPNVIWQAYTGWPTLEFMRNAALYKNAAMWPHEYASAQILMLNPVNLLVWIPGIVFGLFGVAGRRFRLLSLTFIFLFLIFVLTRGKTYYLSPGYLLIIPLGAWWWEQVSQTRRYLRPALLFILALGGVIVAPFAIPLLPVETFLKYQDAIGITPPREEKGHTSALPQHFGDRFGWPEMVQMVADAYGQLSVEDRQRCVLVVSNYGEAGALNYYGPRYGLPRVLCGHNNYFLWGTGNIQADVALVYMSKKEELEGLFTEVREVARFRHPYAMPYENDRPLYLCHGLKAPFKELWPRLRFYQ